MEEGARSPQQYEALVEQVRQELHIVAEGHATLNRKIDRVTKELRGDINRLNEKMDYGFTKVLTAIGGLTSRMDGLVTRFDTHERAHAS